MAISKVLAKPPKQTEKTGSAFLQHPHSIVAALPQHPDSIIPGIVDTNKYNWGQHYRTGLNIEICTINVDWFEATYRTQYPFEAIRNNSEGNEYEAGEIIAENSKMRVVLSHSGHGISTHRHLLFVDVDGQKVANMLYEPRNKHIGQNQCRIKIENWVLYHPDWVRILQRIEQAFDLTFNNVTRLDIAIDSPFIRGLIDWIEYQKANQATFAKSGRLQRITYFEDAGILTGLNIGDKSSDKHATIYNKSIEMEKDKNGNKAHIKDTWRAIGMDSDQVYRFELKMKSGAVKAIADLDIYTLDSKKVLAGILKMQLNNWFEWRIIDKDQANTSRWEKVKIFDWDKIKPVEFKKIPKRKNHSLYATKMTIKTILQNVVIHDAKDLTATAEYLVKEYQLQSWIKNRWDGWLTEWTRERKRQGKTAPSTELPSVKLFTNIFEAN